MATHPDGRTWGDSQKPIELILLRELAGRLSIAVSLFDATGKLVYLNESAENLLALLFDEVGEISQVEFIARLRPTNRDGAPIPVAEMPSGLAPGGWRPQHRTMLLHDARGAVHQVAVTDLPLHAHVGGAIGAMTIYWPVCNRDEVPPAVP
jgi:hypothetical protein